MLQPITENHRIAKGGKYDFKKYVVTLHMRDLAEGWGQHLPDDKNHVQLLPSHSFERHTALQGKERALLESM